MFRTFSVTALMLVAAPAVAENPQPPRRPTRPCQGRPVYIEATKVFELRGLGMGPAAIAKELGIAWSNVYWMLGAMSEAAE
jgi:hypothetical protein